MDALGFDPFALLAIPYDMDVPPSAVQVAYDRLKEVFNAQSPSPFSVRTIRDMNTRLDAAYRALQPENRSATWAALTCMQSWHAAHRGAFARVPLRAFGKDVTYGTNVDGSQLSIAYNSVDIVFLVDCTASMQPVIEGVRMSIEHVIQACRGIVAQMRLQMRLAFVGYRDLWEAPEDMFHIIDFHSLDDADRPPVMPWPSAAAGPSASAAAVAPVMPWPFAAAGPPADGSCRSMDAFCEQLRGVQAKGGADVPENMEGAFMCVLDRLSWFTGTRNHATVFHLTDAPCHSEPGVLHDLVDDHGKRGGVLSALNEMRRRHVRYYLFTIDGESRRCDKMVEAFKSVHTQMTHMSIPRRSMEGGGVPDAIHADFEDELRHHICRTLTDSVSARMSEVGSVAGV